MAALIAVYGLLADPETAQHEINAIHGMIPWEAQQLIEAYLKSLVSTSLIYWSHRQRVDCFEEREIRHCRADSGAKCRIRRGRKTRTAAVSGGRTCNHYRRHRVCIRPIDADSSAPPGNAIFADRAKTSKL
jgi:hypothetical protein